MRSTTAGFRLVCQLSSIVLKNSARWTASANCIGLPRFSYLNSTKLGEFRLGCSNSPASTMASVVPSGFRSCNETATILVGTSVSCRPLPGSVPIMVYGNVWPLKTKDRVKLGTEITPATPPGFTPLPDASSPLSSAANSVGTVRMSCGLIAWAALVEESPVPTWAKAASLRVCANPLLERAKAHTKARENTIFLLMREFLAPGSYLRVEPVGIKVTTLVLRCKWLLSKKRQFLCGSNAYFVLGRLTCSCP